MHTRNTALRSAVAATALLAFGAMPVYAADVVYEEPPAPAAPMEQPPLNTWAGPYAGVSLGYGFASRTNARVGAIQNEGFVGGGFAGYNFQSGGLVYGLEGDVNYNGIRGSRAGTTSRSGIDGSLRARFGYAITDNVLIYGTGGGAIERRTISDAAGSDTNAMFGYTVGAGVDALLTQNIFGRVEYRFTDYGSRTFNTGSGPQSVNTYNNKVTVGMGVKF